MNLKQLTRMYNFSDRTVVITGGGGVLGSEIAGALLGCGANVVILDRDLAHARQELSRFGAPASRLMILQSDVLQKEMLQQNANTVREKFGHIDCLINGAGGNHPKATTSPELPFFDLPVESFRFVSDLNLLGTILPSQVFGKSMAERGEGIILNISSMNAFRPLTKIPAYSAAKAAVSNFTQWLATHVAQEYSPTIRVNAIAPGFFVTHQNRFLLYDEKSGELTERGRTIIDHTPMGRFGEPEDLLGTVLWLLSPASAFVTGIVVPIDGGFSAFSGV